MRLRRFSVSRARVRSAAAGSPPLIRPAECLSQDNRRCVFARRPGARCSAQGGPGIGSVPGATAHDLRTAASDLTTATEPRPVVFNDHKWDHHQRVHTKTLSSPGTDPHLRAPGPLFISAFAYLPAAAHSTFVSSLCGRMGRNSSSVVSKSVYYAARGTVRALECRRRRRGDVLSILCVDGDEPSAAAPRRRAQTQGSGVTQTLPTPTPPLSEQLVFLLICQWCQQWQCVWYFDGV